MASNASGHATHGASPGVQIEIQGKEQFWLPTWNKISEINRWGQQSWFNRTVTAILAATAIPVRARVLRLAMHNHHANSILVATETST